MASSSVGEDQLMVEVVTSGGDGDFTAEVQIVSAVDGIGDHSYCTVDGDHFQQVIDKYHELSQQHTHCLSLWHQLDDKVTTFMNECLCESIIKSVQKQDILQLMDKMRRLATTADIDGHLINDIQLDISDQQTAHSTPISKSTPEDSVQQTGGQSELEVAVNSQSISDKSLVVKTISGVKSAHLLKITTNQSLTTKTTTTTMPSTGETKSVVMSDVNVLDKYLNGVNYNYDYMPGVPKRFPCLKCDRVFASGKQRANHQRSHQKPNQKYIHCQHLYCKKRFVSPVAFKQHMDKHLGIESTGQTLDGSGSGGGGDQQLDDTLATTATTTDTDSYFKRKNRNKEYQCDWSGCGQWFALPSLRKQHYNIVHLKINRFSCIIPGCSAQFIRKTDLEAHIGVEHGFKFYKCDWNGCDQQFFRRSLLVRHHKTMHLKIKSFKCDECEQSFTDSYKLSTHRTNEHNASKRFACDWADCLYSTNTRKCLVEHLRIHTGERPHKCMWPGCDRAFAHSYTLTTHTRVHTGEKPYKCDQNECPKVFRYWGDLKIHKKKVHSLSG